MIETSPSFSFEPRRAELSAAVRRTLAYADIFDYPLTLDELHRYLHGTCTSAQELQALLASGLPGVEGNGAFYVPSGRLRTIAERRRRELISEPLIGRVQLYARALKYLPYVRMIGLTGSLAMANVEGRGDIDLMLVAAPGRVWLVRAAAIAMVYLARLGGDALCPNYLLAENDLALHDRSIYCAHELAQMVPLHGHSTYRKLWAANPEVSDQLPNARAYSMPPDRLRLPGRAFKWGLEQLLAGALGARLEAWESGRKIARLSRGRAVPSMEIVLEADRCKGHFDRHRAGILAAYHRRLARLESGKPRAARTRQAGAVEVVGA